MNIKKALTTTCMATAGLLLIGQSAHAGGSAVSYNDGDIFLGFRQTGGTSAYLLDLGQPDLFMTATPGSSIVLNTTISGFGDIGADLSSASVFGSSWYTDGNVFFAVTGGTKFGDNFGDPEGTLYSTNPSSTPWTPQSDGSQVSTVNRLSTAGFRYSLATSSANSDLGVIQSTSTPNNYASFQPGGTIPNSAGISFAEWNPTNEGLVNTTLYFNQIISRGNGDTSVNIGFFSIDSGGLVTFTAAGSPIPEPSTYALLGMSTALMGFLIFRRRNVRKA
ncbi:MAG: PEP-CTERM sorting domain-containing protein [Chthoniobacterales bacterium]